MIKRTLIAALLAATFTPQAYAAGEAKNIIFFLGDGMGPTTVTAARIYKYQEEGQLNLEKFERTARIKTYSNDAQTTDSAPSMAAYMTGIKANNEVISMSADTVATAVTSGTTIPYTNTTSACSTTNGSAVTTILELAKANGKSVGAISTTELTHATPAATFSHICNRNAQYDIAAQLVPGGTGFNSALGTGVDVLMGGGRNQFTPYDVTTNNKGRADGRNLLTELGSGYTVAATKAEMVAAPNTGKFIGLYSSTGQMEYELDRVAHVAAGTGLGATQPSLAEMTSKAIDILSQNTSGYFLMVEGGRIDHALHGTNAKRVLEDTIAFDDAIKVALDKVKLTDPTLANTLIVVTADHDHTMTFNGYVKRGNPILGISTGIDGNPILDKNGATSTTLVFGNGPNRPATRTTLSSATVTADNYKQETGVRLSSETHGGGDVALYATGAGAKIFKGTLDNTKVFGLLKTAFGF